MVLLASKNQIFLNSWQLKLLCICFLFTLDWGANRWLLSQILNLPFLECAIGMLDHGRFGRFNEIDRLRKAIEHVVFVHIFRETNAFTKSFDKIGCG